MPAVIADVGHLEEDSVRQFPLDTETVLLVARDSKVGIDTSGVADRWSRATRGQGAQISGGVRHRLHERNDARVAEDQVAFRLVVKHAPAGADYGLVAEWRPRDSNARTEQALWIEETAIARNADGSYEWAQAVRHAHQLIRRHGSCAQDPIRDVSTGHARPGGSDAVGRSAAIEVCGAAHGSRHVG